MKVLTRFRFAAAAVGVLLFTGCSSITNSHLQKEPLMAEYLAGKDARVELRLSEKLKSALNTGDELMWRLEAGAFFFNIGDYRRSVNEFERAEALIADYDDRPTVSVCDAGGEGGALLTNLNALPYRGWSKDVERAFGTLEDFVREFPGWCGDSPEERPEDNGRILRRMKERGELMTFETFAKCFAEKLLPKYENHIGEDGLSPDQRYHQAEKARADTPDWATMAIFKSQSTKRVVTTQGVRLNNQLFWHPEMADIIREQVTIYYNRGYNPSVSVFSGGHFVCEAEPVELMALIDPDEERVAAHMADQKRQQRKVTDRLAYIRQSTKRITREAYAEEIDEQRQRMATVTSLEAARAGKAKQQVADKAAGRRKAASAGENAVRSMIAANGEKLLKRSAR